MNFQEYQARATESADYPEMKEGGLVYPALGLAGEAGEVADKIKKIWSKCGRINFRRTFRATEHKRTVSSCNKSSGIPKYVFSKNTAFWISSL